MKLSDVEAFTALQDGKVLRHFHCPMGNGMYIWAVNKKDCVHLMHRWISQAEIDGGLTPENIRDYHKPAYVEYYVDPVNYPSETSMDWHTPCLTPWDLINDEWEVWE